MIHPVVCNPVLGPLVGVKDPVRWLAGRGYPSGAILHFDANADPYTEQTGGPHTFEHAVLSPQYQRNADGSYTDVGAKPAVDTFDGEKWLRSCGQVTNILPVGAEDFRNSFWIKRGVAIPTLNADGSYRVTLGASGLKDLYSVAIATGSQHTLTVWAKKVSGSSGLMLADAYTITGRTSFSLSGDFVRLDVVFSSTGFVHHFYSEDGSDLTVDLKMPMATNTPYPVPYVPPGITQPASNATTTGGSWFTLPDGSALWKALTGQPLTLATRVRMGVGSGGILNNEYKQIIESNTVVGSFAGLHIFGRSSGGVSQVVKASDGVSYPAANSEWSRNSIIRRVTQVNTAGTQFRVGYMIEGTHTAIQWGSWTAFDGSFNPSTLYRLMLGYANAYPMWFNKITAWKEQVSDARIMEAMS